MSNSYNTRSSAQKAANKANDLDSEAFWVVAHDSESGWFIENLNSERFDYAAEIALFKRSR